jgi:molybdopterin synthase sulfur carrier subunit
MSTTPTITVRYFASLREALGPSETLPWQAGQTLAALRDALIARDAAHAQALSRERALRCALNQQMAKEDAEIPAGAEVAFFPPVTGG